MLLFSTVNTVLESGMSGVLNRELILDTADDFDNQPERNCGRAIEKMNGFPKPTLPPGLMTILALV